MAHRAPTAALATHMVTNQPPDFAPRDLWRTDPVLQEAVQREGGGWAEDALAALGSEAGSERVMELGELANRNPPALRAFDRYGRRLDEVEFHPAYHALMELAFRHRIHAIAWTAGRSGGHVEHAALGYLLTQAEAGVLCPVAMTYAAVPALRRQPELVRERHLPGRAAHTGTGAGGASGAGRRTERGERIGQPSGPVDASHARAFGTLPPEVDDDAILARGGRGIKAGDALYNSFIRRLRRRDLAPPGRGRRRAPGEGATRLLPPQPPHPNPLPGGARGSAPLSVRFPQTN
jgi:hypothetical protein